MKLLLIDDEPHIRQMMRLTLEAAGYQVDEVADGAAGIARFGDGREYAAVVLDQKMPGLTGLETLQRIKGFPAKADDPGDASRRGCGGDCQPAVAVAGSKGIDGRARRET